MTRLHFVLFTLALGCTKTSSTSTSSDDGASSDDGDSSTADAGPTTLSSSADASSEAGPPASTGDDGSSSAATGDPGNTSTGIAEDSSEASDDSSSGGPTQDCSSEKAPCVLEPDVTVAGAGGVDEFFVYTVGTGDETVEFSGADGDYASWFGEPWAYACAPMGSCCLSDGSVCEKPLLMESLVLGPGDTAYFVIYTSAPWELTITSG